MYLEQVPEGSKWRHIAVKAVEHVTPVPEHMREEVLRWVFHGRSGGFLRAVVSNDLFGAAGKADLIDAMGLAVLALYFYNYAPIECYGSDAKADAWAKQGGILGILSKRFKVVAVLPDGQRFSDEAHVGGYHEGGMTRREAEEARGNLDMERPIGHEDVRYEIEEEK